jgi:hypothetical protein
LTNHQPFFHPPLLLAALCPRADPSLYRISLAYARTYPHKHLINIRHRRINALDRDRVFAENLDFSSNTTAEMLHSPSAIPNPRQIKILTSIRIFFPTARSSTLNSTPRPCSDNINHTLDEHPSSTYLRNHATITSAPNPSLANPLPTKHDSQRLR